MQNSLLEKINGAQLTAFQKERNTGGLSSQLAGKVRETNWHPLLPIQTRQTMKPNKISSSIKS